MKVTYNITQNKFNANLNQETTEIKVKFQTGYYPLPGGGGGGDTSNLVPYTGANKDVNIGAYYFETSQGFKKTGGTANQALTANGGVFDLNTKADLEGGKVLASQSRPSTIVMDNSTYVITFTDATGTVQTIDLPLESLFKDANYDETTKSLIVTLQDGTTRTIPLSDLVDLPEIVLSTANPAVTPTSGQKVYFNTSLGKVWFNVGGNWVFGGNLISDSEKDNLTTAYNHSQTTGNTHGTKLEELNDVSGTDTMIIDTDEIIKKEVGGLWKKLSWSNIKATLKAYFDNLYAPKAFNVKVTTPSSWVTGTTSETQVLRIEIPANSLSESDLLKIPYLHISKIGSALVQTRIKLSTSPTMPSGTTDQIAQYSNPPATLKYVGMMRTYKIYNGQIWGYSFTDNGISDITTNVNNGLSSKPFNRSETNYLYVSLKLGDSTDQARLEGIQLTNS